MTYGYRRQLSYGREHVKTEHKYETNAKSSETLAGKEETLQIPQKIASSECSGK
jgi:hypothetical protein